MKGTIFLDKDKSVVFENCQCARMYINNRELSLRVETNFSSATNFLTSVRHFIVVSPGKIPLLRPAPYQLSLQCCGLKTHFSKFPSHDK